MSFENLKLSFKILPLILVVAGLFGCAAAKRPLTGLVPGKELDTLQSAVTLSASSGAHSTAGRGYLVYKAPARFHLALVTPFGQPVLDAYGDSDQFTCLIPSRQQAYAGLLSELPEESLLRSMALLKWVMAPAPFPVPAPVPGQQVVVSGVSYSFDEMGMLERKVSPEGDEVTYGEYRSVDGIAFPGVISIKSRHGAAARIVFEDPLLNRPVEAADLVPDLAGMSVLPLAAFRFM